VLADPAASADPQKIAAASSVVLTLPFMMCSNPVGQ